MYNFRFWFEHGGGCLWSSNDAARAQYGYKVMYTSLPISESLKNSLMNLEAEYHTILNFDDPAAGYLWSSEQKADFLQRAKRAYGMLCRELGVDYCVVDESDMSV